MKTGSVSPSNSSNYSLCTGIGSKLLSCDPPIDCFLILCSRLWVLFSGGRVAGGAFRKAVPELAITSFSGPDSLALGRSRKLP